MKPPFEPMTTAMYALLTDAVNNRTHTMATVVRSLLKASGQEHSETAVNGYFNAAQLRAIERAKREALRRQKEATV